jgi:hypothetical protein
VWGSRARMVGVSPGRHGWRSWRGAKYGFRATTLYAVVWAAEPGWSGSALDGTAGGRGGREMRIARNDPMRGCVGRPRRDGRGPHRTARPAVVAERRMRLSRKDPMQQCADRQDRDGQAPHWPTWPAVVPEHGMRISCNNLMQQCVARQSRDGRGPHGTARPAVVAKRRMRLARNDPMTLSPDHDSETSQRGRPRRHRDADRRVRPQA